MKRIESRNCKYSNKGVATVEFAIILPLLLLMLFGVIEVGRLLQANLIVSNLSREGANLAARSQQPRQTIMQLLAETASPLNMATYGMIYITIADGTEDSSRVSNQFKWTSGGYTGASRVWDDCGSWSSGTCTSIGDDAPLLPAPMVLEDGERVYVVEVFYDFRPIIDYAIGNEPVIYSLTVF